MMQLTFWLIDLGDTGGTCSSHRTSGLRCRSFLGQWCRKRWWCRWRCGSSCWWLCGTVTVQPCPTALIHKYQDQLRLLPVDRDCFGFLNEGAGTKSTPMVLSSLDWNLSSWVGKGVLRSGAGDKTCRRCCCQWVAIWDCSRWVEVYLLIVFLGHSYPIIINRPPTVPRQLKFQILTISAISGYLQMIAIYISCCHCLFEWSVLIIIPMFVIKWKKKQPAGSDMGPHEGCSTSSRTTATRRKRNRLGLLLKWISGTAPET